MSKNKNETLPDWVQDERDAYIDAIWPASKQSAPSIEPRPLGSIGDYAQFHTFLGAFAEAYKVWTKHAVRMCLRLQII